MNLKRMPPLRLDICPRPQPQILRRPISLRRRHRLHLKNNPIRRPDRPRHWQRRKHRPAAVIPQHPKHRSRRNTRPRPHFLAQHRAQILHLIADPRQLRPRRSSARSALRPRRILRPAFLLPSCSLISCRRAQNAVPPLLRRNRHLRRPALWNDQLRFRHRLHCFDRDRKSVV